MRRDEPSVPDAWMVGGTEPCAGRPGATVPAGRGGRPAPRQRAAPRLAAVAARTVVLPVEPALAVRHVGPGWGPVRRLSRPSAYLPPPREIAMPENQLGVAQPVSSLEIVRCLVPGILNLVTGELFSYCCDVFVQ